jgi:2-dehydro-3-deoxy-D-gluconate 5-dehydrogenase
MNLFDLKGRVAIVTGGNGGIGLGMAEGLAQAGATVMLAGRNAKKAESALAALRKTGGKAEFCEGDVTKEADCQALVKKTADTFGRVDILINNAGTNVRKQPEQLTLTEWMHVMDTNLTSTFMCAQAVYPAMLKAKAGKIVNIGSMLSIFGTSFAPAYAASKGGVVQLTKSLASAWAKDNIQVNAVLPGWIETDLTAAAKREVEGLNERVVARTPAKRWGKPAELAGVAVFLCSGASDFVTGTAIPIDGGFSVQG